MEIDLDLNAHANASAHYDGKKLKAAKQQKTIQQNEKALLAAEKTAQQKLEQATLLPAPTDHPRPNENRLGNT